MPSRTFAGLTRGRDGKGSPGTTTRSRVGSATTTTTEDTTMMRTLHKTAPPSKARAATWKLVTLGTGAAAGALVELVLSQVWRTAAHAEPPSNAGDRRNPWGEALVWGGAIGLGAGLARVVASRSAAKVWEVATNDPPPGTTA